MEESAHGTVFTGGNQFGKTRSETFQKCFVASNVILGGKNLSLNVSPFHVILHIDNISKMQESCQSMPVCKSYAT